MTTYTVESSEKAWASVQSTVRYLSVEKGAPDAAARWLARLLAAVQTLEQLPRRTLVNPRQTRLHGVDVHSLIFERAYLVFYAIDDDRARVVILSFRHGARDDA